MPTDLLSFLALNLSNLTLWSREEREGERERDVCERNREVHDVKEDVICKK
jgi:hypothetical protein